MSRKFLVLSALALGLIVPASAKVYTRDEAVKTAMENSADIKTAEEDLVKASSAVEGGYGAAYPQVDLSADIKWLLGRDDVNGGTPITDIAGDSSMEANKFDKNVLAPTLDKMANGMSAQLYPWQSSVSLTVAQVLYAAGQIGTGINIAKGYKLLAETQLENQKITVRYDVETAFDELILLDSAIAITEESIKLTEAHLETAKQSYQSGMGTELDVIRAELALDQLKSEYEQKKKNRILARNKLLNTMGLNWDSDVEFVGELRNPESNVTYPDTAMSNVLQRRKEITLLKTQEEIDANKINIAEAGYKPTVALYGGIVYSNAQNHFYEWDAPKWDKLNKFVGLKLTMNLFNGFQSREGVTQAKSTLRSSQIKRENAERGFRMQIEACANTLEDAQTQLELQKRQIELATRNYDLTDAAYKIGHETQVNLLDANLKLHQARLGYMQAVLNWNKAYNALLQATGEY